MEQPAKKSCTALTCLRNGTIGGIINNEAMKNIVTHIFQRAPKCVPICVDVQTEVTITAVVHYSLRLMQ